ncbi:hypothetical protein WICANDRAFT_65677 [Wickerhamomyces anomalus NRRL Y-366-8]|uniref:C3HC-type domain-containing protein n=1 Tax=Wickerhamomyces anomalus (strain ATCC 58044 / CBS 1984 / NCYC 433 / NRRL Y-366-8) TaxID=683960 RepID=A0A1E3NW41_WICAA|nr:uncharacterized protein WICANDRAFT_65677 [Wickerhamomyces anomalus NRRL Y-366-8]ODQ56797.1 hypothetical protein WICANDRAFT_65677 [Wickerhamomyces anomalus NRRL Y-366-8]
MDTSRGSKVLGSIDLESPAKISPSSHRITKLSRPKLSQNKTIKYFQSISKRRLTQTKPLTKGSYLPYDKRELVKRINTLKYNNWNVNSKKLTPLLIARYGWEGSNKMNELKCCCCSARLLIKIPDELMNNDNEDNEVIFDKLCDKYIDELKAGHKDNCPWLKQVTPMNVYEINNSKELGVVKELYEFNSKQIKNDDIEVVDVLTQDQVGVIRRWCEQNGLVYGNIFQCSLFGWRIEKIGSKIMLKSESCGRRVFIEDNVQVNLIEEHHEWCCYVEGYKNLIKMMGNVENNSDENTVENTLQRLDKLRKLYFE